MLQLWQRMRGERLAPAREDLAPRLIGQYLPDVFILEYGINTPAVFRLAGTRFCLNHGLELRRTRFLSLWQEQDRSALQELLATVNTLNVPAHISFEGVTLSERTNRFEMLLMPLKEQPKQEDDTKSKRHHIFGSVFAIDPAYWLGADRIISNRLLQISPIAPDIAVTYVTASQRHQSIGAAALAPESQWHSRTITKPVLQVGHLRLFDGGKN